jgi:ubiquinone/menaquinone biosynthesis C-methylase UbiE
MVAPVPQTLSAEEIRDANARYHDQAAGEYDSKWGIDFGELGRRQVTRKLRKTLGEAPERYPRSLEVGAGTGYFTLNMLRAGLIGEATCSDLSARMLSTLQTNASRLGVEVRTEAGDAERLPFTDAAFDLVVGHAVLHHIPDLPRAFAEFERVLAPGGTIVFAGEPSRCGNRLARVPKRTAWAIAPLWRRAIGARSGQPSDGGDSDGNSDANLEDIVDIHAFAPAELSRLAREAGFERVRVTGEELLANWFGWANRTLESSAEPRDVPWAWRQYAYRGYLILQELDRRLLESRLPAAIFYNLMLAARKRPGPAERT